MSTAAGSIGRPTVGRVTPRARRRPSRAWYWLAGAVVLLGVAAGITWGTLATLRAHDRASSLPRTSVPGRLVVNADAGASTLVYFEGEGKPSPDALGLSVTGPDGGPVTLRPYDLRLEYEIAGWMGTPIASFSAPSGGAYTVSAEKPLRGGDIAAGENFVRTQALNVVGALALVGASVIAGLVIAVVILVRRSVTPAHRPA